MSTTSTPTRSYAQQIGDLMRGRPDHDTPPAERAAWLQSKTDLLAAVATVEATR